MTDKKVCAGCDELKPLTEFSRSWSAEDGRRKTCRVCNGAAGDTRPRAARSPDGWFYQATAERMTAKHIRRLEGMK